MQRGSITGRAGTLRVFDLFALVAALPIAGAVLEALGRSPETLPQPEVVVAAIALALLTWGASASFLQLYVLRAGRSPADEAVRVGQTLGTVALTLGAVAFATKHVEVSRLLTATYLAVVMALTLGFRVGTRIVAGATHGRVGGRRFAVVGTGGLAREVLEAIDAHPEWGLVCAGFVQPDGASHGARGNFLGRLSELGAILEREVIDVVVFAVSRERLGEVERAVHVCEELGVEVRLSLDILRFGPGRMMVVDMDGVPMLAFTRTPTNALALALKRGFDLLTSALVLVLLSPVFLVIAVAVRLDSPGPIFFRQKRVGQNGRLFDMVKFRSMYQDAEARLEALKAQNEMSGPVFKMANDPRITKVGRFLRKTSLDEFPQFWNVLKGEMSIVGPRPPIPAEVRQYKRWQRRRLSMKPGITCIWQISGRNNIDFERWMELDLQYIDEWSLWGDIQICMKTIPAVLSARGAR